VVSDFLHDSAHVVRALLIGARATMQKLWSDWGVATDVPTTNPS